MLSPSEQVSLNLQEARDLRASGSSYREIRRTLKLSAAQLLYIRKALSREKGARTKLRNSAVDATDRDMPVAQSVLPAGLRSILVTAGFRTLGDLADSLASPDFEGLAFIAGIGPHRARLVERMMAQIGLQAEVDDLVASVQHIFPDLRDNA